MSWGLVFGYLGFLALIFFALLNDSEDVKG
jgi:hypothetical protein